MSVANIDPTGFIRGLKKPIAIDEVQKAPAHFPAIKIHVDSNHISLCGYYSLVTDLDVTMIYSRYHRLNIIYDFREISMHVQHERPTFVKRNIRDVLLVASG